MKKDNEKKKTGITNRCYECGGEMEYQGCGMASELFDTRADDDTHVSFYTCKRCGRIYEIVMPDERSRHTLYSDYYDDGCQEKEEKE